MAEAPPPGARPGAVTPGGLALSFLAGGLAGPAVDAVFYPIDTLKTRLQARSSAASPPASSRLYAGIGANTAGSFLSAGAFFAVYEVVKRRLEPAAPSAAAPLVHMGSAAVADLGACAFRVPFELIKQRLQAGQHRSTAEAAVHIWRTRGAAGFYTGFVPTLMREVPFDAVEFALYEALRAGYLRRTGGERPNGPESMALGAVAGGAAGAATTPLDVIKTRLMTQTAAPGHPDHYAGMRDCAARIWREEGPRALFRGASARVAWISLGGSVFFGVYEKARQALAGTGLFGEGVL